MECTDRNLITRIWTFYHSQPDHACFDHLIMWNVHKTQQCALGQKFFDLWSSLPALCNLWLLLVKYYLSCLQTVIFLLSQCCFSACTLENVLKNDLFSFLQMRKVLMKSGSLLIDPLPNFFLCRARQTVRPS